MPPSNDITPIISLVIIPPFWPKMPPMGLGFLQSFLLDQGINTKIVDLNNLFYNLANEALKKEWLKSCNVSLEQKILSFIRDNHPKEYQQAIEELLSSDIVGFSCFKSNFAATLEIAGILKKRNNKIRIIFGGPEITRQFFKGGKNIEGDIARLADFLVVGEGEKPAYDFINSSNKNRIAEFDELKNLGSLSFPRYAGLNPRLYPQKSAMPLQFSRGCIRKCNFCSEKLLYSGFRARPVDSVIEEIKYHKGNCVEYFVFFDSLINADLVRLEKLCDKIIDNFGSINWEAQLVVRNDMSQELIDKIKKSGCYNLFVGLESGSDNTLRKMNKGFSAKEAEVFFGKLNKAGISFGISLIIGYPGESEEDFKESLDFIIRNKNIIPKIEQINPFVYYDGTNADRGGDYRARGDSLRKTEYFIREIKRHNFKYTNAFLGNLIEK